MAEYTENYNLKKPAQEDFYNVDDFNNNADIIDSQLKAVSDKAAAALPATSYTAADILNKLKTVDGINSGLDADLFKGESIIPVANGGTGVTNNYEAIRTLGNNSGVFLTRTPERADDVSRDDINSLKMSGVLLTDGANVANIPNFFDENGRKVITSFGVGNYNDYDGYIAFDHYSHEIAMRMGQAKEWERIVTDYNIAEMFQSALQSGGVSVVKSVQRGTITIPRSSGSATATISSVQTNKSIVVYGGMTVDVNGDPSEEPYLTLTNSTTVTATRKYANTNVATTVSYQVIEYY